MGNRSTIMRKIVSKGLMLSILLMAVMQQLQSSYNNNQGPVAVAMLRRQDPVALYNYRRLTDQIIKRSVSKDVTVVEEIGRQESDSFDSSSPGNSDCGTRISECGTKISECGTKISECGTKISECGTKISEDPEKLNSSFRKSLSSKSLGEFFDKHGNVIDFPNTPLASRGDSSPLKSCRAVRKGIENYRFGSR